MKRDVSGGKLFVSQSLITEGNSSQETLRAAEETRSKPALCLVLSVSPLRLDKDPHVTPDVSLFTGLVLHICLT